jgi:soluble cytochrome b562
MGTAAALTVGSVAGGLLSNNASKKAASQQSRSDKKARAAVKDAAEQARADIFDRVDTAEDYSRQGYQDALDVFAQTIPQQANTFTQGNINAQQAILAGLPQIQNAILGAPINYNAFQPTAITPDFGFVNQAILPHLAKKNKNLFGGSFANSVRQNSGGYLDPSVLQEYQKLSAGTKNMLGKSYDFGNVLGGKFKFGQVG